MLWKMWVDMLLKIVVELFVEIVLFCVSWILWIGWEWSCVVVYWSKICFWVWFLMWMLVFLRIIVRRILLCVLLCSLCRRRVLEMVNERGWVEYYMLMSWVCWCWLSLVRGFMFDVELLVVWYLLNMVWVWLLVSVDRKNCVCLVLMW